MSIIRPVFNYAAKGNKHPLINLTRSTIGTYGGQSGLVRTAPAGVLRPDYDPVTGAFLGHLYENVATSRVLHNRDAADVVWTRTGLTSAKDAVGIDGIANSASTLTATAANATATQTITIAAGKFVFSPYVKRKTGTGAINITIDGGTTWIDVTTLVDAGVGPNGFARVETTKNLANPTVGFRLVASGDEIEIDFAGMEGGTFPTNAIATTGAAVTRNTDVADVLVADIPGLNSREGTMFFEAIAAPGFRSNFHFLGQLDIGNNTDFISLALRSAPRKVAFDVKAGGGAVQASMVGPAIVANQRFKVAASWKPNDFQLAVDGVLSTPDTSGTVPQNLTDFRIANRVGADRVWGGTILQGSIFGVALGPGDLQELTT